MQAVTTWSGNTPPPRPLSPLPRCSTRPATSAQGKRPFATLWSNSDRRADSTHESPPPRVKPTLTATRPPAHVLQGQPGGRSNPQSSRHRIRCAGAAAQLPSRCGCTRHPTRLFRPAHRRWLGGPSISTDEHGRVGPSPSHAPPPFSPSVLACTCKAKRTARQHAILWPSQAHANGPFGAWACIVTAL